MHRLILPGDWSEYSCNKSINRAKNSKHVYNSKRKKAEHDIGVYIHQQLAGVRIDQPFAFVMEFYCRNRTTDPSNLHFLSKHVLDEAQNSRLITGDGWKQVAGNIHYEYFVDVSRPRVEIFFLCGVVLRVRALDIYNRHLAKTTNE